MRREWIDEGKPRRDFDDFPMAMDAGRDEPRHEGGAQTGKEVDGGEAAQGESAEAEQEAEPERNELAMVPEGLEALEKSTEPPSLFGGGVKKEKGNQLFVSDDEEDDLDALLAAQASNQGIDGTAQKQSSNIQEEVETHEENYDDEMEAMAGFDDPW